jgi:hypothetical protein
MELITIAIVGIPVLIALYSAVGYLSLTLFGDYLAD